MDVRNIAVVVEDVDAARTALEWSLENIIRYGDIITLIHVYPFTRSKSRNKARLLRLKGFQLALSFQHICNNFSNTKVEIVVTEDNQEGMKIVASVREIGASILVVGLHDRSFLYKLAMANNNVASYFNCRVFAIKQPPKSPLSHVLSAEGVLDSSINMDFSQIDISRLQVPVTPPPKVKYRICPDPAAIIWRLRRSRRRR
ncbi:putative rossmann-like alpha/beta/alpha sandwich protein [Lupinus albus]|uniref:Putative rossmann-like alpha/beta/alpha sandwich protein n=1 Tax=Lupinus albus TaxID=3870 RepID=A0A6A4Q8J7_LUPAL|nr:putative rossmann-like alpha/beta/alpha sandwich protein [Lupinus albus]